MKWPEKLLHFIWRYKLINQSNLTTTQGESLRILDFGQYNTNAGADFEFAKIQIDHSVWVGNIELHISSSDWKQHHHHLDPRYNSTILHVIWESPGAIAMLRLDGTPIPTLVLKDYVDESLLNKYYELMHKEQWIACENLLYKVSEITISNWLTRLTVERLESKMEMINLWGKSCNFDWEKIQLVSLARAFGMKVNGIPFENLVLQINSKILFKYSDNIQKIEAFIFGLAGLLPADPQTEEGYVFQLKEEYKYLKHIHHLTQLSNLEWKFLRMRPYNLPTFRMAQFCALLKDRISWFEYMQSNSLKDLSDNLIAISASKYWENHFHFEKPSKGTHSAKLTKDFVEHLLINAFIPVMFAFGKYVGNIDLQTKALEWLQELPVENNAIITKYKVRKVCAKSAADSQAVIHLNKNYCTQKKCLDCAIGFVVLSR